MIGCYGIGESISDCISGSDVGVYSTGNTYTSFDFPSNYIYSYSGSIGIPVSECVSVLARTQNNAKRTTNLSNKIMSYMHKCSRSMYPEHLYFNTYQWRNNVYSTSTHWIVVLRKIII